MNDHIVFDCSGGNKEYECSIKLKLSENQFDYFLENHEVILENVICYYNDFRTVDEKCQKKTTLRTSTFSKIIFSQEPFLLPFTVTESLEEDYEFDFYDIMHTIKHRHVLFSAPLIFHHYYGYVRIGVEATIAECGGEYNFVAELETDYSILNNLGIFRNHAIKFWEVVCKFLEPIYALLIPTLFDPVAPSSFHCSKSRKFIPIHKFSANDNVIYTHKYDGGKAKMIVNNGYCKKNKKFYDNFSILINCNNLISFVEPPESFLKFPNIIFQFEMMQSPTDDSGIKNLILVDCCGGIKNKKYYLPFPDESLKLLEFFNIFNPIINISISDKYSYLVLWENELKQNKIETFRLCVQQKIIGQQQPFDKTDGKLAMFGHKQSKVKPPTIDVFIINGFIRIPNNLDFEQKLPKYNRLQKYDDGIYEITYNKQRIPQILRKRFDRTQPSAKSAINAFICDWEHIYSLNFFNAEKTI